MPLTMSSRLDFLAGALVDALVADRIHRALVEPVEVDADLLRCGVEGDRHVHQAEADGAFPDDSRHGRLLGLRANRLSNRGTADQVGGNSRLACLQSHRRVICRANAMDPQIDTSSAEPTRAAIDALAARRCSSSRLVRAAMPRRWPLIASALKAASGRPSRQVERRQRPATRPLVGVGLWPTLVFLANGAEPAPDPAARCRCDRHGARAGSRRRRDRRVPAAGAPHASARAVRRSVARADRVGRLALPSFLSTVPNSHRRVRSCRAP